MTDEKATSDNLSRLCCRADHSVEHCRIAISDITERTRVAKDLKLRERAIESSCNGIIIADATQPDNPVVYAKAESEQRYRSFLQNFQGIALQGELNIGPKFLHGAVEEITGYKE